MKAENSTVVGSTKEIADELLLENAQLLFLPSGCENLKDSHHEFYLDCPSPESAICLSKSATAQIAVSCGCDRIVLLESKGGGLRFAPAARVRVPIESERLLQHLFDALEGHPNQRCAIDFVEWLYSNRPTSLVPVVERFLANPDSWLIGLPGKSPSTCLRSKAPIYTDGAGTNQWYQLRHMEIAGHGLQF